MKGAKQMNMPTTTRRRLLRTAGAGAGLLAMPAIVRAAPAQLNIAFFLGASPFMIAKADGSMNAAANTKCNWIEVGSGAEIVTGIASGSMDMGFGIGSSPTAAGIAQGVPYEIVAMMDNIGPAEEMTVRKSANLKTPADFKGKKVAVPFGSTSHFRLLGFLKTNNLTQSDVTVLDLRPDAMVAAWTRGDIDAGYVWAPPSPSCSAPAARCSRPTTCWRPRGTSSPTSSSRAPRWRAPIRG
jgi:taurine transport system substrate-binding protein